MWWLLSPQSEGAPALLPSGAPDRVPDTVMKCFDKLVLTHINSVVPDIVDYLQFTYCSLFFQDISEQSSLGDSGMPWVATVANSQRTATLSLQPHTVASLLPALLLFPLTTWLPHQKVDSVHVGVALSVGKTFCHSSSDLLADCRLSNVSPHWKHNIQLSRINLMWFP